MDFEQIGKFISTYIQNRAEGVEVLLRLTMPDIAALSSEEFKGLRIGVVRDISHASWAKSINHIYDLMSPAVNVCHLIQPSIPNIEVFTPLKRGYSLEQLLLVYVELQGAKLDQYFDALIDFQIVESSINLKEVKSNPELTKALGDKLLEFRNIDASLMAEIPDFLFPTYKAKFIAANHLWDTLDLHPYFELLRILEMCIKVLKSIGYKMTNIPDVLSPTPNTFEIPVPYLSLLEKVPLYQVVAAASADFINNGSTRLPTKEHTEFVKLYEQCKSEVVLSKQERSQSNKDEIFVDKFLKQLAKLIQNNLVLLSELRIKYVDYLLQDLTQTSKGLLWGRVFSDPESVRSILLVEGKSEYIAFAMFSESFQINFSILGVLRVDCGGKQKMPDKFLEYKKTFPGTPIVCILDNDAKIEAEKIKGMLVNAPKGSRCFVLGKGTFEDEFSLEQIATALNTIYPEGDAIASKNGSRTVFKSTDLDSIKDLLF